MAETVKVEIPIVATDKTSSGVASAQRRFDSLDRTIQKTQRQLNRLNGTRCKVGLDATDTASDKIANLDDAIQKTNGSTAHVSIDADGQAIGVINDVDDAISELNGEEAVVEAGAEDAASGVLSDIDDRVSELNGEEAVVDVEAEDAATGVLDDVFGKLEELDGSKAIVTVQAQDDLSGQIGETGGFGGGGGGSLPNTAAMVGAAKLPIAQTAAVMGASFGVYDSISTFSDFESAMSQVKAISGAVGEEFDALTEKAKYMGATTKFTATESATAFNYMAMAGWKTDDMLEGIEGIMNLAAASGENLGTTSDIVTDALTAFGMKASDSTHFADVMAQASANANTNVSMLGESFKYVGPVAGALGYTIEDTALALGLMANSGVKSSMAGTALRRTLSNLAAPTDNQAKAMEKYGISMTKTDGSMKNLSEVMTDLRSNLSGLSQDEQTAAITQMFGSQAMAGMLAIVNATTEDYNKLSEAVNNADGASQDMAETMLDNMKGSFTLMQSAIEGVEDALGERLSPYMRSLADGITAAMPDATNAIQGIMDKVDELAGKVSATFRSMISSEEWQDADFLGKIDIAWDTLVAQPFREWIDTDGYTMIGDGLSTLFSKAANVFTGDSSFTDWLSLGAVAMGVEKLAGAIGGITTAIKAFPGIAALGELTGLTEIVGPALAAAAGVSLAVWSIKTAVDHYNALTIENNLAEHFGDLSLSAEQAAEFAGQVVPIEGITAELHVANVAFNEANSLMLKGQAKLSEINTLQWKLQKVDLDTSEADLSALQTAAGEFRQTLIDELGKNEEGSNAYVDAILGESPQASHIKSKLEEWFSIDADQIDSLSQSVSAMIQNSIDSGFESVETATAISILQSKMMEIANGARKDELQGKLDWLSITSSGAALDADSWAMVTENIGSIVNEFMNEDAATYQRFLGQLRGLERNDPERAGEIAAIRQLITDANADLKNTSSLSGWDWMYGSLMESYGQEFNDAKAILGEYNLTDLDFGYGALEGAIQDFGKNLPDGTQGALADRFEKMLPTAQALETIIDTARNEGKAVPKAIMDAYNEAVELSALSGGEGAGQWWANMVAGDVDEAGNRLYESLGDLKEAMGSNWDFLSDDMKENFERAFTKTAEDIDYSGILDSIFENVDGTEVNWKAVNDLLNQFGYDISDALAEKGIDIGDGTVKVEGDVTPDFSDIAEKIQNIEGLNMVGEGVIDDGTIDGGYITVTVKPNYTLSGIAEDNGMNWNDIAEHVIADNPILNGDPNYIEPEWEIKLRVSDLEDADVDTSGMQDQLKEAVEEEPVEAEPTVNETGELGEDNFDVLREESEERANEAFDPDYEEEGQQVNVTAEAGTDNFSTVYEEFARRAQETFNVPIPVSATISATSTGSGGGTGEGPGKSANGRFVNGPMLSWIGEAGPEYVIPVGHDKQHRGMDLWLQAGADLGVPGFANGGIVGGSEDDLITNPFEVGKQRPKNVWEGFFGSTPNNSTQSVLGALPGETGSTQGQNNDKNYSVNMNVTMSPTFQIEGGNMDEEKVFRVIQGRIRDMADDISDEVAERVGKVFENMPIYKEV